MELLARVMLHEVVDGATASQSSDFTCSCTERFSLHRQEVNCSVKNHAYPPGDGFQTLIIRSGMQPYLPLLLSLRPLFPHPQGTLAAVWLGSTSSELISAWRVRG